MREAGGWRSLWLLSRLIARGFARSARSQPRTLVVIVLLIGILVALRIHLGRIPIDNMPVSHGILPFAAMFGLAFVLFAPIAGLFVPVVTVGRAGVAHLLGGPASHRVVAAWTALNGATPIVVVAVALGLLFVRGWSGLPLVALLGAEVLAGYALAMAVDVSLLRARRLRDILRIALSCIALVLVLRATFGLGGLGFLKPIVIDGPAWASAHPGVMTLGMLLIAALASASLLAPVDLRDAMIWRSTLHDAPTLAISARGLFEPTEPEPPIGGGLRSRRSVRASMPWLGGIGPFVGRRLALERATHFGLWWLLAMPIVVAVVIVKGVGADMAAMIGSCALLAWVWAYSTYSGLRLAEELRARATTLRWMASLPLAPWRVVLGLIGPMLVGSALRLVLMMSITMILVPAGYRALAIGAGVLVLLLSLALQAAMLAAILLGMLRHGWKVLATVGLAIGVIMASCWTSRLIAEASAPLRAAVRVLSGARFEKEEIELISAAIGLVAGAWLMVFALSWLASRALADRLGARSPG